MLRKKRNGPKLAALKQRAVLIAFFLRFSGPINGDPSNRYLIASRWGLRVPGRTHRGRTRALLYRRNDAIKNIGIESVAYKANQQITICTIEKLCAQRI